MNNKTLKYVLSSMLVSSMLSSFATTYYVSLQGNDDNDGLSEATAFATPAKAATLATTADDEIIVAAGTYASNSQIIIKNAMLRGATGNPEDVIFDGLNATKVVRLNSAKLANVTVCNGFSEGDYPNYSYSDGPCFGAGISGFRDNIMITNCIVRNCLLVVKKGDAALGGAGIALEPTAGHPAVIADCRIYDNVMTNGLGVGIHVRGTANIERCEVYNNFGGENKTFPNGGTLGGGGGMKIGQGSSVIDCNVYSNVLEGSVSQAGLGIVVQGDGAPCQILRSRIWGNSATDASSAGAAIALNCDCRVEDCSIVSNHCDAAFYGAGVCFGGRTNVLLNCLIEGNTAGQYSLGAAVSIKNVSKENKYYLIDRCIFRGNKGNHYQGGVIIDWRSQAEQFEKSGFGAIRNCLFVDNASNDASMISIEPENVSIENCSIICSGGYIYGKSFIDLKKPGIRVSNCYFKFTSKNDPNWHNPFQSYKWTSGVKIFSPADLTQYTKLENNYDEYGSLDGIGTGNISGDAQLDENFVPTSKSPCRDAGMTLDWMLEPGVKDVYGNKRIFGEKADIGCAEGIFQTGFIVIVK